ncbi:hypothetical protein J4234_00715 [Candidatus Woesearchaeota archaeon]|nr:hypothetical protein [Candidatus Woesearchaeota archaeon]
MHRIINEGSIQLKIPKAEKISKEMGVFYNPIMGLNRDISILLLNSLNKKNMQICDLLAASGVRSIRFLKELNKNKIKKIIINDYDKKSIRLIKYNLKLNDIHSKNDKKIIIRNKDANFLLLSSAGFDYIDIDPFGTPNPFLDAACKRIARNGILAVTATDTSALCGTFPKVCLRKYWAIPKKNALMHETGLRILIRKIQLIGAQYEKALVPIFSYSKEHYMRVFFRNEKGKNNADNVIRLHGFFNDAGPMWLGKLFDKKLSRSIYESALRNKIFKSNKELLNFLHIIKEESKINSVGFYDISDICSKYKIKIIPKKFKIIEKIRKLGYGASETHFKGEGLRSNIPINTLINIIKQHKNK